MSDLISDPRSKIPTRQVVRKWTDALGREMAALQCGHVRPMTTAEQEECAASSALRCDICAISRPPRAR